MGTRLDLVLTPVPDQPSDQVARWLQPLVGKFPAAGVLVAYFEVAEFNGRRLLATHLSDQCDPEEAARLLSLHISPALYEWYSDSLGEAGFVLFEGGSERLRSESPIPGAEPMYPRFQEGLRSAFVEWSQLGPEEVLDLVFAPEAESSAFVLGRDGVACETPEPYFSPPPAPRKPSIFAGEFSWGIGPRRALRALAFLFGLLVAVLFLVTLAWWAMEALGA